MTTMTTSPPPPKGNAPAATDADPDDDNQIFELIDGLPDEALDLLNATCHAATTAPDTELPDELQSQADATLAALDENQRSLFQRAAAGDGSIERAAESERLFRQSPQTAADHIHKTIGGMNDDQLDVLRAACEAAAIPGLGAVDLDDDQQGAVDSVMNSMTSGQRSLVAAGGAGANYVRLASWIHHQSRHPDVAVPTPHGYGGPRYGYRGKEKK